ncbi:MAG: hypothetical protein E5299_01817 [Burkholderia gladioli]|nr:MAG: hypothetical protein E5299_01817 [Burkholderia gladioli]
MTTPTTNAREPRNKGKPVGQKAPLRLREIWAIRMRLEIASKDVDLALFNLAIDSTLRACDLTKLRVRDIAHGDHVSTRAIVMQQKTPRPVRFEITAQTIASVEAWIRATRRRNDDFSQSCSTFSSHIHEAVRPNCESLGNHNWSRPYALRIPYTS